MKRSVTLGLAAAAVFAVLLAFTGAAAAETVDFSSGSVKIPVGNINVANGDTMNVKIDITNIVTNADGSKLQVKIDGLHDIMDGIKLSSFNMKLSARGVDTANSPVTVGTLFFPVGMGSMADLSSMVITEKSEKLGFNLLDLLNNQLYFVTLDILPTSTTASVSMDISANVATGKSISPVITLSNVDVSKLKDNPAISLSITSGGNKVSKSYTLAALKVLPTLTATPTPTPTPTLTPTPTPTYAVEEPTISPVEPTVYIPPTVPFTGVETPAPFFGIFAAICFAGCIACLRRK